MESLMTPKPFAGNDSAAILDGYGNASLSSSIRVFYPFVLFMSMLSSGESFEDEERDRFQDHAASGPELLSIKEVEGEKCKDACMAVQEAAIYSWTPNDVDDDDATVGTCKCIESLMSVKLSFNSFSGFLGPRKFHLRRGRRHSFSAIR
nr:unnamed protein product [Haemonchus contortus]